MRRLQKTVLLLLSPLVAAGADATAEAEILRTDFGTAARRTSVTNAAHGSSFSGVLPDGWSENYTGWSAAACTAEVVEEDGVRFLRFVRTGETAQFRAGLGVLAAPATYRATMTFRSRPGCQLGLRENPAPYTTYGTCTGKAARWATVTNYISIAQELTTSTGLFVYPGVGETDLKEVRLCRVPPEEALPPRRPVEPGRVEFWGQRRFPFDGPCGWNLSGAPAATLTADPAATTPDGIPSLRLEAPSSTAYHAPPMQTSAPGQAHTLAFRYRAVGDWYVSVRAADNAATLLSNQRLPASAEWRTARYTVVPRAADEGFYATFTGSGTLHLDAPSCRAGMGGAVPETGPEAVVACGAGDAAVARIQFEDEPAAGRWAAVDAPAGSTLKLRETDLYGDETALGEVALTGAKLQTGAFAYARRPGRPYGQFRIEAWIERGGARISPVGETVLTRLPRPLHWHEDAPGSPFGTHLTAQTDQLAAAKAGGVNWTRFHDAGTAYSGWYHLESEPGSWTWPDAEIDLIRAWRIRPFAQLGTAPTWATRFADLETKPDGYFRRYLRPVDPSAWTNYVSRYVARYRGRVDDYFVWNEPWGRWWKTAADAGFYAPDGAERDFAELCRTAYLAAKAANPSACISGYNTTSGNADWGRKLTQAGAFAHCDAVDYHFYTPNARATTADEVPASRSCLAPIREAHPGLDGKPVIMSEGQGNASGSGGDWHRLTGLYLNLHPFRPEPAEDYRRVADNTARYLVSILTQGDARLFLYSMHCHTCLGVKSSFCTLVGDDGFPHPMLVAHAAVARRLDGAVFLGRGAFGRYGALFAFRGADGRVTTFLSGLEDGDARALAARTDVEARDLFGNPFDYAAWWPDELVSVTGTRVEAPRGALVYAWTGAAGTGSWEDGGNWRVNGGEATDHGPFPGTGVRFDAAAEVTAGRIELGDGMDIAVARDAAAVLRVPISGDGAVGKSGEGRLVLAGPDATFSGTLDVTGGVLRVEGREPLGPCTVRARAVAPVGRVQFAGAETRAAFAFTDSYATDGRTSCTFVDGTTNVLRGPMTGTTCTYFDVPRRARLVLAGGSRFNYANMSVAGALVVTNLPFEARTMQGSWEHAEFWTAGNGFGAVVGWHATWSPQPMAANVDFRVDRVFDDPSMTCSVDGVWDLHGTVQRIGSFNSVKASSRIRSFDGPARLEINQTGTWRDFASRGSPTGIEDFAFRGAFEGETSLRMAGTAALVLAGTSTATGCVEVAGGTLVFTNGASWRTATNVAVRGTGRIRVADAQALGPDTVLRLDGAAVLACAATVTVRELWLDGARRPAGLYGAAGDVALPPANRTARLAGPGALHVLSGPHTLLLIR